MVLPAFGIFLFVFSGYVYSIHRYSSVIRKQSKAEATTAIERISHRKIEIERGVLRSGIWVHPFQFIYQIFQENGWLSIFDAVNIYPPLVHEFYMNLEANVDYDTYYVDTKVCGTRLHIILTVINEVTSIPLT
jgi:hypothetical protein